MYIVNKTNVLVYISSECSAQGHILHCKRRNQGCSSAEGRSSTANSGSKAAVLLGAVASRCFSHPTLSLASEQTLKGLKRSQWPQRGGKEDSANWVHRTSPKFTTGVKYQFHQGFWPDPDIPITLRHHIYNILNSCSTQNLFEGWHVMKPIYWRSVNIKGDAIHVCCTSQGLMKLNETKWMR